MKKNRNRPVKDSNTENSSLSEKIGRFFHTKTQKEKVLRYEDFNAAGDVYYAGVSAVYKVTQRILWLVFVLFVVVSMIFHHSEITYDNFYYLIKDFSGAADVEGSYYETLSYESDDRQQFTLYRGGLATVSPSKISVFTATGRRTLNLTSAFSSPYMVSSPKYVLVYDTSGTTFSLYNSFARVFTETLEYPISNACLAEDGSFVIVTRTADRRSVVTVYNKSFKKAAEWKSDDFVFDIVASRERNALAVLSYDAGNGTGRTTLAIRDLSNLEEIEELYFDGEFPLACGFLEGRRFALLTDRHIRIFDRSMEEQEISRDYSEGNITGYTLTAEGVAVSAVFASQNTVCAFDASGTLLYDDVVDFNVSDIGIYDSCIFLQTEQGVRRMDPSSSKDSKRVQTLSSGVGKMLIYNKKTVLVCGESKAEYLIFRD